MSSLPAMRAGRRTDGNFRLPRAAAPLPFTGERMTTAVDGQIAFEHYHRYCLARDLCDRRDVLDIAAGEGYGAALLAGVARSVVGVEIDAAAVAHAQANYPRDNLRFLQGDALAVPLADASVDVAVSFETLEHVADPQQFVAEIRRVLRPGGMFVVSTPDRTVYSAHGAEPNPFHVQELTEPEFRCLMQDHFANVRVLAQRAVLGSVLAAPDAPDWRSYERRGQDVIEATNGLARAQYLVAVASNAALPGIASSAYMDRRVVHDVLQNAAQLPLVRAHEAELLRQLKAEREEAEAARGRAEAARLEAAGEREAAAAARRRVAAADTAVAALRQELRRKHAAAECARRQLRDEREEALHGRAAALDEAAATRQALDAVLASSCWRMTGPLRGLVERHPGLRRRTAGWLHRHPAASRQSVWLARNLWRLLTLRRPLPRPRAPATAIVARVVRTQPMRWLFVGDTLDWLGAHRHLSGVGKVTANLLAAAWDGDGGVAWHPAVAAPGGVGLAAHRGPIAHASPAAAAFQATLDAVPQHDAEPQPGDHVLFTGVTWTATGVALLARLREAGVAFSVLVYDIIPIEHPAFASAEHRAGFVAWLRAAVRDAETIFVPCEPVRSALAAWCIGEGLAARRPLEIVAFGDSTPAASSPASERPRGLRARFVLSVGTIDARKNQTALCRAWVRLVAERGAAAMPQLVLVGRQDLPVADGDAAVQALVQQDMIRILDDVADAQLDGLYRAALFTAFASRAEGHGLPVADSLGYGKLAVASDLPVIRAYAGDLAWYFDPADPQDACRVLRRAIDSDDERQAAERRIVRTWRPRSWQHTARAMDAALAPAAASALDATSAGLHAARPAALPAPRLDMPFARLRLIAQAWCGTAAAPDVSILIVNWNAADMTLACVRHVWANTTGVTYEILIADNGSAPEDIAKLHVLADLLPGMRVFALGENRYFGEANNILAEHADGRLLCLLNNDVFVSPGWLQGLRAALDGNPKAGAVAPVLLFPDGTIQEAGGSLDAQGIPDRHARGRALDTVGTLRPRAVDYASAAALLLARDAFMAAGGFDLAYEPAYYEDADLCLKLAAMGREVWLCADVTVMHVEGYSTRAEVVAPARKKAIGDLNRAKFVARWGRFLGSRDPADLAAARANVPQSCHPMGRVPAPWAALRGRALVFTPYALTPGGGERYLLTMATVLAGTHDVTLVTPHPYSRLRLRNLAAAFGLDLSALTTAAAADLADLQPFDLMVTMGNHIVPPIAAQAPVSLFLCQFPFAMPTGEPIDRDNLLGYDMIIAYSEYTRQHVADALIQMELPALPVQVIHPPVPQIRGDARRKKPMILTVGRFFVGGHAKRHDLLIEAFRCLHRRHGGDLEFHVAGSSMARPEDIDYLDSLRGMAADLPVVLHVNCSAGELQSLYGDAAIYWHGTGLATDLARHPEHAEHFGIAIVEAMSAECVAFAFDAGGAREIITDGVDGLLYRSAADLIDRTLDMLGSAGTERRGRIGEAASRRARVFSQERFAEEVRGICGAAQPAEADVMAA